MEVPVEKSYDISRLLDFYGEILTDRQRLAVSLYYNDDLSLSEVAEEMGISRQGVRASLVRSEETLREMERKLGLAARFDRSVKAFAQLREYAESVRKQSGAEGDEKLTRFADRILAMTKIIEQDME